jgi:hypothetical protein
VSGRGTANYVPKFTASQTVGNSLIYDSGSAIGIGITAPTSLLHVSASGYPAITIQGGATAGGGLKFLAGTDTYAELFGEYQSANNGMLLFRTRGSGTVTERMRITSAGRVGINVSPDGIFHVKGTSGAQIIVDLVGNSENYYDANTHVWRNGSYTERMRITSGGQLLIGMSSAVSFRSDSQLQVNNCTRLRSNDGYNGNPSAVIYSGNDQSGTMFVEFTSSGFSRIGSITRTGGSSIAYNTTSDIRLKKNINNALSSINKINSIQVRSFDWVSDNAHQDFGFIAQELINVAPEAVTRGIKENDICIKCKKEHAIINIRYAIYCR